MVTYNTFQKINIHSNIVDINVIGLWIPVGIVGAGLFTLASPLVSLITGKRSDAVWGSVGLMVANYVAVFFGILGIMFAAYFYHLITAKLDENGYVYCGVLTTFSATGRHEVYVARPELCAKPRKAL